MIPHVPTANPAWMSAAAGMPHQAAGKVLLVSMLVLAGIGAAAAPLLADLLSAAAGLVIVYLAFAAWTATGQTSGRTGTTNSLGAT